MGYLISIKLSPGIIMSGEMFIALKNYMDIYDFPCELYIKNT